MKSYIIFIMLIFTSIKITAPEKTERPKIIFPNFSNIEEQPHAETPQAPLLPPNQEDYFEMFKIK